jgi:hypothetical protein
MEEPVTRTLGWLLGVLLVLPLPARAQDAAAARYRQSCDDGDGAACVVLGMMYERGAGVQRSAPRAVGLYQRACDVGELRGCVNLGVLLEAGIGADANVPRARELFARACEGGDQTACDLRASLDRGADTGPATYFKAGRIQDAASGAALSGALLQVPELGIRVVSDDDGRVSLGRIPAGEHGILVERFGYEPVDGEIEVPGNAEFVVMMPAAQIFDPFEQGRIVGRVTDANGGSSLANVAVSITGDSSVRALSNVEGRFELRDVTAGLVEVQLSSLGYATRRTWVVLQPGASVELAATMSQQAIELEPIEVMVRSGYLDRSGFYRRAQQGWGTHFAPDDIERINPFSAADLIRYRVPGVRVDSNGTAISRRGFMTSGACALQVFMDGIPSFLGLEDIPTQWLDAVEVYHGVGTPIQYQFNNQCGVVLIWTTR